jgi:hypothetical protein
MIQTKIPLVKISYKKSTKNIKIISKVGRIILKSSKNNCIFEP